MGLGVFEELTGKEQEGTFWGVGNVPYHGAYIGCILSVKVQWSTFNMYAFDYM